ncbi:MAG: phosphoadenosine phosphosulfate reductase family protein [Deltaproteobacteria bacterium]|nr:phosphoadenosine phosphosulfate reductase family protein [Deltaproteobacteria bacterium]
MNQDTDRLMGLPLEEKIEQSKAVIQEALERFSQDELYLAWTGGKDSTTMLWLYRQVCQEQNRPLPRAMFIDEGHVFEEILELVDKVKDLWNVDVCIAKNTDVSDRAKHVGDLIHVADLNERNRKEIEKLGYQEDTFPFEPESFVGNHLMKTVAMNVFMEQRKVKALSTAIRWDEQEARIEETFFSPRKSPDHTRVHPILHFKERDIWDTIHQYKIPFCSLYYQGYRSLGAKGSTTKNSDIPAWEQDLENTPERAGRGQDKEQIMSQLRSLGYM